MNNHGLSRKAIFESVAASLERLDVEYIDVLQCHRFDYETPIEETMDALHDVSRLSSRNSRLGANCSILSARQIWCRSLHRNVELLGASVCRDAELCQEQERESRLLFARSARLIRRSLTSYLLSGCIRLPQQTMFISMQNFYNALYREEEREMLPTCKVSLAESTSKP